MSTIKEKIAVMQAYADGKPIEIRSYSSPKCWIALEGSPTWNWMYYEYRIAPNPRTWYITGGLTFTSRACADGFARDHGNTEVIEVREVLK